METEVEDSKDLARALRRDHAARLKKARGAYWGRWYGPAHCTPLTPRQLGQVLATPRLCSLVCCGNPRRWLGERTVQELRARQHELSELLADAA